MRRVGLILVIVLVTVISVFFTYLYMSNVNEGGSCDRAFDLGGQAEAVYRNVSAIDYQDSQLPAFRLSKDLIVVLKKGGVLYPQPSNVWTDQRYDIKISYSAEGITCGPLGPEVVWIADSIELLKE